MHVHAFILGTIGDLENSLTSLKDCDTVDVLTDLDNKEDVDLVLKYDRFITRVFSTKENRIDAFKKEINKLVDKTESDYILLLYGGSSVKNITKRLYETRKNKKVAMIRPEDKLNKLIVDTKVFRWLCGFGEQEIQEKIEIQAKNENLEHYILNSIEELDECEPLTQS